jgi:hypothetical protein
MNRFLASLPDPDITAFCERWRICGLSLIGSVLRDDFGPESDVDILVAFKDGADWGLLDHVKMQHELQEILHLEVDLVTRPAIEQSANWIRRREILETARVVFPAQEVAHETR